MSRTLRIIALGLFMAVLGAAPAAVATTPTHRAGVVAHVAFANETAAAPASRAMPDSAPVVAAGTPTPAPRPPELSPPTTIGMPNSKVVIGVIAVVLFVIVFYGRKVRKNRKKNGGGGA